jgi:hypothetical protein
MLLVSNDDIVAAEEGVGGGGGCVKGGGCGAEGKIYDIWRRHGSVRSGGVRRCDVGGEQEKFKPLTAKGAVRVCWAMRGAVHAYRAAG